MFAIMLIIIANEEELSLLIQKNRRAKRKSGKPTKAVCFL